MGIDLARCPAGVVQRPHGLASLARPRGARGGGGRWLRMGRAVAVLLLLALAPLGDAVATGTRLSAHAGNPTASFDLELVGREDPGYAQVRYRDGGAHTGHDFAEFTMAAMDVSMDRAGRRLTATYRGAGREGELPSFVLRVRGNRCTVEIGGMTLDGEADWTTY